MIVTQVHYDYAAQPKVTVACPICGTANPSRQAVDRYGYRIGLSTCRCELIYLNPRLTAEGYADFYRHVYRPLTDALAGFAHTPTTGTKRGTAIGAMLRAQGVTGASLLDVGGGTGAVASAVGTVLGCRSVTVLDPSAEELTHASARGCHTICGLAETQPPSDARYDVILCTYTADHWLDPLAALRWMRSVVAPGGSLWIDIVEAREWIRSAPLDTWKIDHPLYWTGRSLLTALKRTDWTVQSRAAGLLNTGTIERRRMSVRCQGV